MKRPPGRVNAGVAEIAHVILEPRDRLFCVTDGVLDSRHPGAEDFGEERLVALLSEHSRSGLDAAETVRQFSHTILDHHGVLTDDTTAFLVDFHERGAYHRGGPQRRSPDGCASTTTGSWSDRQRGDPGREQLHGSGAVVLHAQQHLIRR